MLPSGLVIVTTNDDVGSFQRLVEFRPPLAGAHRVAGRSDAVLTQRDDVFLAFDHEDGAACGQLLDQLVQAKQDNPHALDRPLFLIRSLALAELLRSMQWLEAKHLKQQRATLVGIIVGLLDRTEIAATVAFTRFRTIPPAAMTKPRGALAVDLYVEIAAAAGRAFGCVLARARRDVCMPCRCSNSCGERVMTALRRYIAYRARAALRLPLACAALNLTANDRSSRSSDSADTSAAAPA